MLKNFLKIAYRNLFKYKYYSLINILGFAIGLAVFASAFLYAINELSYDKFHKNADRIYRIANVYEKDSTRNAYAGNPFPMARALNEEYPQYIENSCRIFNFQNYNHLVLYHDKIFTEKNFFYVDSSILDIFDFHFITGNPDNALKEPNTVIISESIKKKYFDGFNPIGKEIFINEGYPMTVVGVFRDFPSQSHVHFDILTPISSFFTFIKEPDTWLWNPCWTYILLKKGTDKDQLEKKFPEFIKKYFDEAIKEYSLIYLQPLTDIHLNSDLEMEFETNSKSLYIYILLTISVFLLFVSWLNFINLSIVGSITRIREISIRKIMGSSRKLIVYQFLVEAILLSLISFIVSLFLIEGLMPVFKMATGQNLEISRLLQNGTLFKILGLSLMAGLIVGVYTGLYASSFPVFNIGRFKYQLATRKWFSGKILILVQYIISLILLIAVLINFRQLMFMKNTSLGFENDKIIILPVANNPVAFEYEKFKKLLLENPEIEFVTGSNHIVGTQSSYRRYFFIQNDKLKAQFFPELIVRHDFIKALGIKVLNGSVFQKGLSEDVSASTDQVIINESLVKQLGYRSSQEAIGKKLSSFKGNERIIGVIKDFNTRSLHKPVAPLVIRLSADNFDAREETRYIFVRFKTEISREKIKYVAQQWREITTSWPFDYNLLSQVLDEQYRDEENLNFFLWMFSVLIILIGSMGVWAVSSLVSIQKTKEIGIRKAIGASTVDILKFFMKDFATMLLLANIVAWPITYLILRQWFKNFAIHINLQIYDFLIASFFILVLTLAILARHALKVAKSNTIVSLRDE